MTINYICKRHSYNGQTSTMDGAPTWHSMYPLVQQLVALDWCAFRVALCEALDYPPQLSWQLGDDRARFDFVTEVEGRRP